MLIDTHAHLFLEQFKEDEEAVIDRAAAAGVTRILLPAIDAASIPKVLDMAERYPGICYAMVGIHPSSVAEASDEDLVLVENSLSHPAVVAIGETGLDYYWDETHVDKQRRFLREQLRLSINYDLPVVLHNRDKKGEERTSRDLVRLIKEEKEANPKGERLTGVFHCFGPPEWLAQDAMDLGFYAGIGGTITYKNSGVEDIVRKLDQDRIILETDSPYLAPSPHRGKRNEPGYVRIVAERMAAALELPLEEIGRITTANAERLFRLETDDTDRSTHR